MSDRERLEARWLELTRTLLPAVAAERCWPIRFDHCFQRVLLDNGCGGRWYDHVARRPAFRHATDEQLGEAVRLGEAVLAGQVPLEPLNLRSLAWRGKRR